MGLACWVHNPKVGGSPVILFFFILAKRLNKINETSLEKEEFIGKLLPYYDLHHINPVSFIKTMYISTYNTIKQNRKKHSNWVIPNI